MLCCDFTQRPSPSAPARKEEKKIDSRARQTSSPAMASPFKAHRPCTIRPLPAPMPCPTQTQSSLTRLPYTSCQERHPRERRPLNAPIWTLMKKKNQSTTSGSSSGHGGQKEGAPGHKELLSSRFSVSKPGQRRAEKKLDVILCQPR